MKIMTVDDVVAMKPEFGDGAGWYYSLTRNEDGELRLSEVFPGYGFAELGWRDIRYQWSSVHWIIGDLWRGPRLEG